MLMSQVLNLDSILNVFNFQNMHLCMLLGLLPLHQPRYQHRQCRSVSGPLIGRISSPKWFFSPAHIAVIMNCSSRFANGSSICVFITSHNWHKVGGTNSVCATCFQLKVENLLFSRPPSNLPPSKGWALAHPLNCGSKVCETSALLPHLQKRRTLPLTRCYKLRGVSVSGIS